MLAIHFEAWEEKLPWVKKYQELLSKEALLEADCYVLPKMKVNGLTTHKLWASDTKKNTIGIRNQDIDAKFQTAVKNLISKFCEPIELKYNNIMSELSKKTPERNDYELFTDELKEQYIAAARVRNSMPERKQLKKPNAEEEFDNTKQTFINKYPDLIKHDKSILQDRLSELKVEESKLEKSSATNQQLIHQLQNRIKQLTVKLKPIPVKVAPNITHIPPAPPIAPPILQKQSSSNNFGKQSSASQLPKAGVSKVPSTEKESIQSFFSNALSAQTTVPEPQKNDSLLVSNANLSIDDLENSLVKTVLDIYEIEQIILLLQEHNHQQKFLIDELTKHKKTLEQLDRQQSQNSEPEIIVDPAPSLLNPGSSSVVPPAPPSPPPLNSEVKSVVKKEHKERSTITDTTDDPTAYMKAAIVGLRVNFEDEDEDEDNDFWDTPVVPGSQSSGVEKKNSIEEDIECTLNKYEEKKSALYLKQPPEYKEKVQQRNEVIKQQTQQLLETVNISHIAKSIQQITGEIQEKKPVIKPIIKKVTEPTLEPKKNINSNSIVSQGNSYLDKVKTLIGSDDQELLNKFERFKDNKALHAALEINGNKLDKKIIIDLVILSDYEANKRLEIKTENLSPDVAEIYESSLQVFYKKALDIRLSDESPQTQKAQLKEAAQEHFKPRHKGRRLFADVFLMLGTLCIASVIVGLGRVALGHNFFFSQEKSTRANEFIGLLNDDKSVEQSLFNQSASPAA